MNEEHDDGAQRRIAERAESDVSADHFSPLGRLPSVAIDCANNGGERAGRCKSATGPNKHAWA
jgi:hypothetical protein